jgi:hypothetical protein
VRLDRADAEVGADGSDPVGFGQAGARGPAVGELRLLVGQRELLALVLLGLDPADLVGGRLVADQQHDRAQPVGRQPLAGARGQQSALAGVEGHPRGVVRGAVPMQGTSWPMVISMRASRSMPSGAISRRALGASSRWSSGTRASMPAGSADALVVTSNRAVAGGGATSGSGMADLLDRVRAEIRARLTETRGAVEEYERLQAVAAALGGLSDSSPPAEAGRRSRASGAGRRRRSRAASGSSAKRAPRGASRAAVARVSVAELSAASGIARPGL